MDNTASQDCYFLTPVKWAAVNTITANHSASCKCLHRIGKEGFESPLGWEYKKFPHKTLLLQSGVRLYLFPVCGPTKQRHSLLSVHCGYKEIRFKAAILACFSPWIPFQLCFSERCSVTLVGWRFLCLMLVMHMCPSSVNLKPVIPLYILDALHQFDTVLTYCTRVTVRQKRVYLSFCIQIKLFFLTNVICRFLYYCQFVLTDSLLMYFNPNLVKGGKLCFILSFLYLCFCFSFNCAEISLYGQRAGIKEYQFTYYSKCNKIPPKDILNVFLLL